MRKLNRFFKKYFNKRNIINAIGLLGVTILFLKAYNISNFADLVEKVEYNLTSWKHVNFVNIGLIVTSYVGYITNGTLRSEIISKFFGKRGK